MAKKKDNETASHLMRIVHCDDKSSEQHDCAIRRGTGGNCMGEREGGGIGMRGWGWGVKCAADTNGNNSNANAGKQSTETADMPELMIMAAGWINSKNKPFRHPIRKGDGIGAV